MSGKCKSLWSGFITSFFLRVLRASVVQFSSSIARRPTMPINSPDSAPVTIRFATADDIAIVWRLIGELAEYEKLADQMIATPEQLRTMLFGPRTSADVLLAELNHEPVGYAICFTNYSTFLGRTGLYLEDLFVRGAVRGQGIGRRLLAAVAKLAQDRGCGRLEWSALDWNSRAIEFYQNLGAQLRREWLGFRLAGTKLDELAAEGIALEPPDSAPRGNR